MRKTLLSQIEHIESNAKMKLFHGAKRKISGDIVHNHPLARDDCDFGKSFYMGDMETQAKTLVGHEEEPYLYTLELDLSNLRIVRFNGLAWALVVALNRGKLCDRAICDFLERQYENCDVMIGPIADDKMFIMLNRFLENAMTDQGLVKAISYLNLGTQYALKSDKADRNIRIICETPIDKNDPRFKADMLAISGQRREAINMAERIRIDTYNQGMLMEHIIKKFRGARNAFRPR